MYSAWKLYLEPNLRVLVICWISVCNVTEMGASQSARDFITHIRRLCEVSDGCMSIRWYSRLLGWTLLSICQVISISICFVCGVFPGNEEIWVQNVEVCWRGKLFLSTWGSVVSYRVVKMRWVNISLFQVLSWVSCELITQSWWNHCDS